MRCVDRLRLDCEILVGDSLSLMEPQSPDERMASDDAGFEGHELLLVSGGYRASRALSDLITEAGGIRVNLCHRILDAVDEAIRTCPTAIMIDLRESSDNGLRALDSFKHSPEVGAVPIIIMASSATAEIRDASFARGLTDFIIAPIGVTELIARIRTHSNAYLNVIKRNRTTTAYETLQTELRAAHRALEESRNQLAQRHNNPDDLQWQLRVNGLLRMGIELNQIQDFNSLMDRILTEARHLLHSEAGTIFLKEGDHLKFAFFHNDVIAQRTQTGDAPYIRDFKLPITDKSLAGWVCLTGQPLHLPDCYRISDAVTYRFDSSFDQLLGYRTRSMLAMPLKNHSDRILGVIELINPITTDGRPVTGYSDEEIRLLEHFASVAAVAIERAHQKELGVRRLIRAVEIRDSAETAPHADRVAGYACVIYREWARRRELEGPALKRQEDRLRNAAKLHDFGKIGVSDSILRKPGPLDSAEFEQVKKHADIGGEYFADFHGDNDDGDDAAREVAWLHHEKWDGSGYPGIVEDGVQRGRSGEEIPLFARIVGLADVFDALCQRRSYKEPWAEVEVLKFIQAESGRHFDPELVAIFFVQLDEIRRVRDAYPEQAP